jgi:hypothetical protein
MTTKWLERQRIKRTFYGTCRCSSLDRTPWYPKVIGSRTDPAGMQLAERITGSRGGLRLPRGVGHTLGLMGSLIRQDRRVEWDSSVCPQRNKLAVPDQKHPRQRRQSVELHKSIVLRLPRGGVSVGGACRVCLAGR